MSTLPINDLVREWLRLDKDERTRNEIKTMFEENKVNELEERLRQISVEAVDLTFLVLIIWWIIRLRGRMEAGFSRMNSLIIIQTSQGLASYLLSSVSEAKSRGVVIGHDHRHNSEYWATLTAAVFLGFGFKVYLHRGFVHTPLVPFSISRLKAACGIMITASHNPKDDNGYKVYWENAVQIISPHDKAISKAIQENLEPKTWEMEPSPHLHDKTEEMRDAYFAYLHSLSLSRSVNPTTKINFVNTSMHGVGHEYAVRAFEEFGLPPFTAVERQKTPDPDFPTVKFPNPEEKGALDLALEEADRMKADYVLAQDPDADRFTAAEKREDGTWIILSGDMLGAIFAYRAVEIYKKSGKSLDKLAMVASTVSSKIIESMAKKEGFKFVECLTGFKYIGNTALDLVSQGYEVPFAYEEAIGFMIGLEIRDKDGIAATVSFAELAADICRRGSRVSEYLDHIYSVYGYFQNCNSYFICHSPRTIDGIFSRLRNFTSSAERPDYPREIGGLDITRVCDLTTGYDSANPPTYKPALPLSSGHMIQFRAMSGVTKEEISLTIRTSGTEPKIKYYLEGSGRDAGSVGTTLQRIAHVLATDWMQASENGLEMPGI